MQIAAIQKTSLLDYPEKISALVFTQGCNFNCKFCHNPELIGRRMSDVRCRISEDEVLAFLKSRLGKLEAVVITGGEPTIHQDLPEFIKKIKERGFLVGLYTNGANPDLLKQLIGQKLLDYISMDIKTKLSIINYQLVTGAEVDLDKIKKSIKIIKESALDYSFRTTAVPELVTLRDIEALIQDIKGAKEFIIQRFVNNVKIVDNRYRDVKPYLPNELEKLKTRVSRYFERCEIRT